jgi:peptide/nickel transport system substrate-binding protein
MNVRIAQPHVRHGDPHVTSDDPSRLSIHACLYEALVRRAPGGHFRPGLATSWHLSADARRWEFEIGRARFHDGVQLGPQHVADSLRRVRDESIEGELGTSGVFKSYLAGSHIESSRSSVTIVTAEPFADLLDLVVDIPVVRFAVDQPIGTGPFRLTDSLDDRVILERSTESDLPRQIQFLAVSDPQARAEADVDIATDVAPGVRGEVRAATTVCTTFLCNLAEGACSSTPFRQALNWATDVPSLIQSAVGGAAIPVAGPWTERHLGFDSSLAPYGFDPDRAQSLLELSGAEPVITLDVPARLPDESRHLAAALTDMWAQAGIHVSTRVHEDRPAYALRVRDGHIKDAACFDSSPSSTFRILWEKFHSGHRGPWWQGYTNPKLDALVDRARATPDVAARGRLYRQAFHMLHVDAPWVFLYSPSRIFSVSPELSGWKPSADGFAIFH